MELINIQNKLKAPKTQYNSFGKYNYRNCEDILEALKPLLNDNKCYIIITDDIIKNDVRIYVKSTVKLFNSKNELIAETSAFAREEENKKGMDASQLTGSTSSYARKYALNGMFAIDDNKDSDTTNKHDDKTLTPTPVKPAVKKIELDIKNYGELEERLNGAKTIEELKIIATNHKVVLTDEQKKELTTIYNVKKEMFK